MSNNDSTGLLFVINWIGGQVSEYTVLDFV